MCLPAPTLPAPQRDPPASKSAVCAVAGVLHFGAFLQATKCFGIALGNIFDIHDTPLAPGSVLDYFREPLKRKRRHRRTW